MTSDQLYNPFLIYNRNIIKAFTSSNLTQSLVRPLPSTARRQNRDPTKNTAASSMAPKAQKATVPSTAKTTTITPSDPKLSIRSNKGNAKSTSLRSPQAQLEALNRSLTALRTAYVQTTPIRIKLIDVFLAFFVVIGVLLMGYRIAVTSYPFNGFLAAFGGAVGQFVLLAGLRSQVAPGRDEEYGEQVSPERAFADFCFASVVLHVFMFNFLG